MGKKTAPEPSQPKRKQKRKQMFTELATHQEQIVQKERPQQPQDSRRVMLDQSEQDVELDVLEHQNKNIDALSEVVHRLLNKNKVSSKNAFDVPFINLQAFSGFTTDSMLNEYNWKKYSSTLENDYKIYGYRVDAIHSITYSILNNMARRQQDLDSIHKTPEESKPEQPLKMDQPSEGQYLERKIQNLNFTELELVTRMDPILERTKRQFDLLGQQSMMLDTLSLDQMLGLQLVKKNESIPQYPPWGTYEGQWKVDQPLFSFLQIANYRTKFREEHEGVITDQLFESHIDEEAAYWMLDQKQNYNSNNQPDFERPRDRKRNIADEINFKYPFYKNEQDIAEDAQNWMGDMDRKILGLPSKKSLRQDPFIKVQPNNQQNPEDWVVFNFEVQEQREAVFKPDPDKQQHHEQIEDRFLMANRMSNPFDIQQHPTFLRENTQEDDYFQDTHFAVREEVDVRRQNISILQSKKKIQEQIHRRSTFKDIFNSYDKKEEISPALCFLTILHVTNENNYTLNQIDSTNFFISP